MSEQQTFTQGQTVYLRDPKSVPFVGILDGRVMHTLVSGRVVVDFGMCRVACRPHELTTEPPVREA